MQECNATQAHLEESAEAAGTRTACEWRQMWGGTDAAPAQHATPAAGTQAAAQPLPACLLLLHLLLAGHPLTLCCAAAVCYTWWSLLLLLPLWLPIAAAAVC